MKKNTKIAGCIFLVLGILDLLCIITSHEEWRFFTKPLLMPSLAAAALLQLLPEHKGKSTWLLLAGLCFHTLGDTLLLLDSKGFVFFAAGLGAFLVGHFFYLAILLSGIGGLRNWKEFLCLLVPLVMAPILVGLFGVEWPFSAVVSVYALTLMIVAARGVLWKLRDKAFASRVIWGGIIFIISDSLIAVNAFAGLDFPFRAPLVMISYLIAEVLLVSAMVCSSK